AVPVTPQPTGRGGPLQTGWSRIDAHWSLRWGLPCLRAAGDAPLILRTARANLVRPQQHMPRAWQDGSGQIGRRGPVLGNREIQLVAAAPPTEPRTGRGDAARVKDPNIERVASAQLWIRRNPLRIVVRHMHRPHSRRT